MVGINETVKVAIWAQFPLKVYMPAFLFLFWDAETHVKHGYGLHVRDPEDWKDTT